jgi:hypothetical protein
MPRVSEKLPIHQGDNSVVDKISTYINMNFSYTSVRSLITLFQNVVLIRIYLRLRTKWPLGLRRGPMAASLQGLRVWFPPGVWMSVSCECCVLSGRGLCDGSITRPEESYRLWCVWVWSKNFREGDFAQVRIQMWTMELVVLKIPSYTTRSLVNYFDFPLLNYFERCL